MTTRFISMIAIAASAALFATLAHAQVPIKAAGGVMVNAAGMTIYTFDKDTAGSGRSVCNGPCAALWPPVMAAADAKPDADLTIVTRDDGARQWAYKGKPVYLYTGDTKAGDRTGDNFKDVWHVIRP